MGKGGGSGRMGEGGGVAGWGRGGEWQDGEGGGSGRMGKGGEWQDGEGGGSGGRYGTNEAAKEILSRISDCLWVRYPTLPQHSFPIPSTPA